jgi:general secretion pathway protein M
MATRIAVFDRLGLNPRERRLASIMLGVAAVLGLLVLPIGLESVVHARESDNDALRTAVASVQGARNAVRERQEKKDSILHRYQKKAPALAGYLEQAARTLKLEVTDSVDRPEVPHGKRYVERSTVIHLKKAGMFAISKFLESIEKSGMPVAVTRLNIRKRTGEPDSYDVEVGVSAYDRNEQAAPAGADKDKKP